MGVIDNKDNCRVGFGCWCCNNYLERLSSRHIQRECSTLMYSYIVKNIVGAIAAFVLFFTFMHEEVESHFFPVISNLKTKLVSRGTNTVRFTLEFYKVRAGGGVQNSWWIDGEGGIGRYFQTPTKCNGDPMVSGEQPVGTRAHRDLCVQIPVFLHDKPFKIGGIIQYAGPPTSYSGWRIPTVIPELYVPIN